MDISTTLKRLGIDALSEMQESAFEAVSRGNDVVILAPTGSGKTLAYLLPLAQHVDASSSRVQAVVIVPGRELALQSQEVLRSMKQGVRGLALYGGRPTMDEHRTIRQTQPHILFATPGRLTDHLRKGNFDASQVGTLVIDEFDKCLEMGFQEEMQQVVGLLPSVRQRILLSATDAEQIPSFVNISMAKRIDFTRQSESRVELYEVSSTDKDKLETLGQLLRQLGQQSTIVFLNYRESVERVNQWLQKQGFSTSAFHGGYDQKQRENSLYRFSNGSANIFVSTDLASRGLDIPMVSNIIHYHLPETEENYTHRTGRTARWDATGRAFFLLGPSESLPQYVSDVKQWQLSGNHPVPLPLMTTIYIGKGKLDKVSRGDIVGFLCKKGGLKSSEIGRIDVRDRYSYCAIARQRLSQVLKNTQGEKIKGLRTVVETVK